MTKFYIGSTCDDPIVRLSKHNSNHQGFTGSANDWKYVFRSKLVSKKDALALERKIKKRGAKGFDRLYPI